ncbi:hypothetical protein BGZ57DRAFT_989739 [Hyaloscypha finlandica]|nr:hypothetical protein BGZ57DRAFT_989739 [Hyaloscypha finlandica]
MPSWTDFAGFAIGLFVVLHLIAFIRPHGWVSRRLHPSFPIVLGDEERELLNQHIFRLQDIIRLQRARQLQPDPLGDVELVTTMGFGLICLEKTLEGSASKVELPPVRGAGYEPSASSGEPTGVAFIQHTGTQLSWTWTSTPILDQLTSKASDSSSPKRQRTCLRSRSPSNTKAIPNTDNTFFNLVTSPSMFLLSHTTNTSTDHNL